jgi:hypothetical protein
MHKKNEPFKGSFFRLNRRVDYARFSDLAPEILGE